MPLLEGQTIAEVGDALDGDLLGEAPAEAAATARQGSGRGVRPSRARPTARSTCRSATSPPTEYAWQLLADHVVHGWDLAVAIGADARAGRRRWSTALTGWWASLGGRSTAARAPSPTAVAVPARRARQDRLLASFGRDPAWTPAHDVVRRFGAAWEAWDLDAIMALMADDAVFESTGPAPDGRRVEGAAAIRAEWEAMFRGDAGRRRSPSRRRSSSGDRATARWVFSWTNDDGSAGHVRGADVIRVRDGLVAEKLSYVKG